MNTDEEKVRTAIAQLASDWYVANDDEPLSGAEAAALAAWLKDSPAHVEEFLGVASIARDLRAAGSEPEYSLEAVIALARTDEDGQVLPLRAAVGPRPRIARARRWAPAALAVAACALAAVGVATFWKAGPAAQQDAAAAMHFETGHGEQLTRQLVDGSVLHLDTDSAVTVSYRRSERVVMLLAGQAEFEVAHERDRAFRVLAGSAEIVAVGTRFDVRLEHEATVVTVVEGQVAVGPAPAYDRRVTHDRQDRSQYVVLRADQQVRVVAGESQAAPASVDAQRVTAWLNRLIEFDREPLERVAAEFNRYAAKPIEIATPTLRTMQVSGVFATDDTEAFIAFLRSLKGVRVEVTGTRILVSGAAPDTGGT